MEPESEPAGAGLFWALWSRSRFAFFFSGSSSCRRKFFFVNSCIFSLILLHLAHHCQKLFRKLSIHTVFFGTLKTLLLTKHIFDLTLVQVVFLALLMVLSPPPKSCFYKRIIFRLKSARWQNDTFFFS